MLREIQILEEGHAYSDGRVVALGAITWERNFVSIYTLYKEKLIGTLWNLRRDGKYIVGDTDLNLEHNSVTPFLIKLKTMNVDDRMVIVEGTLIFVYAVLSPSQNLQAL